MTAIPVGIVAGFVSFMIQKKIIFQTQNRSLLIAAITMTFTYVVLILMILIVSTNSTGQGIGDWTGTAEEIDEKNFDNVINTHMEFVFFFVVVPSLIVTVLIILGKTIRSKFLIISGIVLIIQGLLVNLYLSLFLLSPADPPVMRPIEGIDFVFVMYRHMFLFGGIMGFFITLVGIVTFWRNRK